MKKQTVDIPWVFSKFIYFIDVFFFNEDQLQMKKRVPHFGSFYLRVGAISFGIGTMVYSGLEFGQYFEMNSEWNQ